MRTRTKVLLLAGAGVAVLAGALATPVLAQRDGWRGGWHGRGWGMMESFDGNGDGRLEQAEIDATRDAKLREFDANGDGSLTLAEYQALWLDAMRERMVRGFQRHDADGDAAVTGAEFRQRFEGMVAARDDNGDGALTRDELRPPRGRDHGRRGPPDGPPPGPPGSADEP